MRYARPVVTEIPVNEVVVEASSPLPQGDSGEPLPGATPEEMAPKLARGMTRRVVEGTFLYGIGQSLPQVVRMLLMLTVFVHFLRPSDYGLIELANCFGAFVMTFMRMGVPGAVTRFYFDHAEGEPLRDYVTTIAWFLLICSLAVGGLAALLWPLASIWLPGLTFYPLAFLVIVGGIVYVNMEIQNRLVQAREQAGYQMRLTILRATISITLALLFVVVFRLGASGLGALGMLAAEVASYGILGLIAVWYLRPELEGRFRRSLVGNSLTYGMGQVPGDFVNTLVPLITRGYLAQVVSTAALGLFSIAVRFTQPLTILINAFQTAYNPIYFSVRKEATPESLHRLATTARTVWMVAVFCALGAALIAPPLVVLILPAAYHGGVELLPILAVAFLGQAAYTVTGPEIYYSKKTWLVPVVVYSAAAADVTIALTMARQYGAKGVACGLAARMVVSAVLAAFFSMRLVKLPHEWLSYFRIAICGLLVVVLFIFGPTHTTLGELTWATLAVFAYPVLLFFTGDPTIREAAALIRRVIGRFCRSGLTDD